MSWSSTARARVAPAEAPPPSAATSGDAPSGAAPSESDDADLTALREQAEAAAKQSPSAANHRRVAELAERAGDFDAAAAGYRAELDALGTDDANAREAASADLQRVRERARGTVADEGASTHRAELDRAWAPPPPPAETKPPRPAPAKVTADDRIVRKWYFWVTLGAIAASAAAVTAIAIKASRDDKPDSLDRAGQLRLGPSGLRF